MAPPTLSDSTDDSTPAGVSIGPRISGAPGWHPRWGSTHPRCTPLHGPRRVPARADRRARLLCAAFDEGPDDGRRGVDRQHLDHAADGVGAVQVAGAAAHDFDAVDRHLRHAIPVDPAAEGVVERHAVGEHQRPAGARGRQPAQRDALRGRVGGARRRTAEQREAGREAQHVVDRAGGRHLEVAREITVASAGRSAPRTGPATGGHGDLLGARGGIEPDVEGRRPRLERFEMLGKPGRRDAQQQRQRQVGHRHDGDAIGAGDDGTATAAAIGVDDGAGPGNRIAEGVGDAHAEVSRGRLGQPDRRDASVQRTNRAT